MDEIVVPPTKPKLTPVPGKMDFKLSAAARSHVPAKGSYEGLSSFTAVANRWSKIHTEGPEVLQPTYHDVNDTNSTFIPTLVISPSKPGFAPYTAAQVDVVGYQSINGGVCILPQRDADYWIFNPNTTFNMSLLRIPAATPDVIEFFSQPLVGNYYKLGNNVNANNVDIAIAGATTIYLADWYRVTTYVQNVSGTGAVVRIAVGRNDAAANIGFRLADGDSLVLENARQRITAFNETGTPSIQCQAFML